MGDTTQIEFECVRPLENHARTIMEWRNDPETLKMSFHSQPKVWDSFFTEFKETYFTFPDLPPLFAISKGKRVAFLRFRPVGHPEGKARRCCDISIAVDPSERGKGLGTQILKEACAWIKQQGYDDCLAEIKKENNASIKAFQQAGFQQLKDITKAVDELEFPIHQFIARLSPPEKNQAEPVVIIAEAGVNWRMGSPKNDLAMAKILIEIAADAGADAVKFQVYRPETVYVPNAGMSDYLREGGIFEDIRTIFADNAMPYEMIPQLAEICKNNKVQFMASAFSEADFAAIDPFVLMHKIASYEITHIRLIDLAARSQKPTLISTGASTEDQIAWAVDRFKKQGGGDLTLLQCTAQYPAEINSLNLRAIPWLHHRFHAKVGLSDHSKDPVAAPVAAVALGAKVIEKHFTIDHRLPGPDHAYAVLPEQLKQMVHAIRITEKMLGKEVKVIEEVEKELLDYCKRGIQATKEIKIGEIFKEGENVAILRAGKQPRGIHPKYISEVSGRHAKRLIPLGNGIQWGDW